MAAPKRRRIIPVSRAKKVVKKKAPAKKNAPKRRRVIPKSRNNNPKASEPKRGIQYDDLNKLKADAAGGAKNAPIRKFGVDLPPQPPSGPGGRYGFPTPRPVMPYANNMPKPMPRPMTPPQQNMLRNLFSNYNKAINTGYTSPLSNSQYNKIFGSMFGRKP
jgi:hypothetical protein